MSTESVGSISLKDAIVVVESLQERIELHWKGKSEELDEQRLAILRLLDHAKKTVDAVSRPPRKNASPTLEFRWAARMVVTGEPIVFSLTNGELLVATMQAYSFSGWFKVALVDGTGSVLIKHNNIVWMRKEKATHQERPERKPLDNSNTAD